MAVSVLVVTVLGTLAKVSLRRGLEAADAERSLQQRWGALTLQEAMLNQAAPVFQLREELATERNLRRPPPPSVRAALTLGGVTFDLLLGDEDAKLSLNSLYHHTGGSKTNGAISNLLQAETGGAGRRAVRLLPSVKPLLIPRESAGPSSSDEEEAEDRVIPDAFRSWGEVFDLNALDVVAGGSAALPNLTTGMTCWGTGQLNFRRASDQAILAVVGSVVQDGGAQRILQRYRERPETSLGVLLQSEVSSPQNRERLRDLLSETSTNFSLWVDASTKAGGSLRYFSVMRRDDEGVTRHSKFLYE